jgi:hypothetical protein
MTVGLEKAFPFKQGVNQAVIASAKRVAIPI